MVYKYNSTTFVERNNLKHYKMKTKVSKSDVFKRAWKIFKGTKKEFYCTKTYTDYDFTNFGDCLKRAWYVEKANIQSNIEELERLAKQVQIRARRTNNVNSFIPSPETMNNYYSQSGYHGD